MEHISKHLQAQLSNPAKETTADLELTPEEEADAIRVALEAAKQMKAERAQRQEKERIRSEREQEWRRPWNSEELFQFIEWRAANEFGFQLLVDDANRDVVRMLCRYFSGDERFETMNPDKEGLPYNLNKGLLLMGNVGRGKSTLMQLFGRNKRQCFNMVSCRTISAKYAEDGHSVFKQFKGPYETAMNDYRVFYQRQVGYCFDDLGTEEMKKHFGNEVNVMTEIILNRYDEKFRYPWTQTHITTNLDFLQIEHHYGTRVRSRMREMFNIIKLDGDDRRK